MYTVVEYIQFHNLKTVFRKVKKRVIMLDSIPKHVRCCVAYPVIANAYLCFSNLAKPFSIEIKIKKKRNKK